MIIWFTLYGKGLSQNPKIKSFFLSKSLIIFSPRNSVSVGSGEVGWPEANPVCLRSSVPLIFIPKIVLLGIPRPSGLAQREPSSRTSLLSSLHLACVLYGQGPVLGHYLLSSDACPLVISHALVVPLRGSLETL